MRKNVFFGAKLVQKSQNPRFIKIFIEFESFYPCHFQKVLKFSKNEGFKAFFLLFCRFFVSFGIFTKVVNAPNFYKFVHICT